MSDKKAADPMIIRFQAILSYPHVFEPYAGPGTGDDGKPKKPKYSGTFLVSKTTQADIVKQIAAKIREAAAAKWPAQPGKKQFLPPSDKLCMTDGDATNVEQNEGYWLVKASESIKPHVVDQGRNLITAEDDLMYPGAIVNVAIRLWAMDNKWGKRVNANLIGVQFVKKGPRLAGAERPAAEDVFDATEYGGDEFGDGGDGGNNDDPFA